MRWIWMMAVALFSVGQAFGALTLEEALKTAHEQNPDVQAALFRVEQASAMLRQVKSGWYPQLSLSGGYSRTDNPAQAFFMTLNQRQATLEKDFNNPADTENFRGTVAVRMLLADGGVRGLAQKMARMNEQAREALLDAARNELTYVVTEAYYQSLQAGEFIAVQKETIGSVEENLRVAKARFDAGSAIQTDVLNLEVQLAQAREQLIQAVNRQRLAVAALNMAIGVDMATTDGLSSAQDPDDLNPPPAEIDTDLLEQRPELIAALFQLQAAEIDTRKSQRSRLPKLMAFGSVDFDSDEVSQFTDSYLAGVMVEWDLFTGFRSEATAEEAQAREAEVRAGLDSLRNHLTLDLRNAHFNALEAWERLDVVRRSRTSAEEALRITRQRYEQGAAEITELLTAQVGLTSTQTRSAAAQYDYVIALANLRRALGEGGPE